MKAKIFSLALVLVLLLMGLAQISGVVHDRQNYREAAANSVARSLAGTQTLLGPLIHVTCTEEWDVKVERATSTNRREFMLVAAPAVLDITGSSTLEKRARGLHATPVFTLKTTLAAQWQDLNALRPTRTQADSRLNCGPVVLMTAVSDARGIRHASLKVGDQALALKPGTLHEAYSRGLHATMPANLNLGAPVSAQLELEILGTDQLSVVPSGSATQMRLRSNWPHPSFDGHFLPVTRTIQDTGFDATWRVSELASSAQHEVLRKKPLCRGTSPEHGKPADTAGCVESFGVRFMDPVDAYALSDRATKYGLLFVGLTFIAVGLFEFMKSLRVHPIQYLLVGAAMSLFFLLLVSLSEHMAFGWAYLLASSACVLLLTYYASHMLRSVKLGGPFGLGIAVLYGLLYLLLQLEQAALVVGSVALFAVLATVMALTRRVDWYSRLQTLSPRFAAAPTAPGEAT